MSNTRTGAESAWQRLRSSPLDCSGKCEGWRGYSYHTKVDTLCWYISLIFYSSIPLSCRKTELYWWNFTPFSYKKRYLKDLLCSLNSRVSDKSGLWCKMSLTFLIQILNVVMHATAFKAKPFYQVMFVVTLFFFM